MREIKFRGKSRDNGKWVYDSLVKEITTDGIMPFIESAIMVERVRVLPESIGQYIGMKDNPPDDTERTEIYEGDIVRNEREEVGQIVFTDGAFVSKYIPPYDWDAMEKYDGLLSRQEVIGNMTDNPELLGDQK